MNINDLPRDVLVYIGSMVEHPGDAVYLGRTCKKLRDCMNIFFSQKITALFGATFLQGRNPLNVGATLWGHYDPQSPDLVDSSIKNLINGFISSNLRENSLVLKGFINKKGFRNASSTLKQTMLNTLFQKNLPTVRLLQGYGIKPAELSENNHDKVNVYSLAQFGCQELLELLHQWGLLNYQTFKWEDRSLTDAALSGGQFELEHFLFYTQKVGYIQKEEAFEILNRRIPALTPSSFLQRSITTFFDFNLYLNWKRLIQVIDHYQLNINQLGNDHITPVHRFCIVLSWSDKKLIELCDMIDDLVQRKANPPKDLLLEAKEKHSRNPEIVAKIDKILSRNNSSS